MIPTMGAIIPAAVGVDIGCGMAAVRTSLTASDLPDNLKGVRSAIEAAVPHGRTDRGGPDDVGAWHDIREGNLARWSTLESEYDRIVASIRSSLGTVTRRPISVRLGQGTTSSKSASTRAIAFG